MPSKKTMRFSKSAIGKRLRIYRKSSAIRFVSFAKTIKIAISSLSELENGISAPSAQTLFNLHLKTDINILWLLTGQGNKKRK